MGLAFFILIQLLVFSLFVIGIVHFISLVKGCFVLRRFARAGRQDHSPIILKSPLVPEVSTIAVPPDASAESVGFARRLLELHFGRNEVVIVLDGPSEDELAVWTSEFRLCPSARVMKTFLATAPVRCVYESRDPIRVVVIDKERGGPVDAWNTAINACTSPVIGLIDPDSDFQPDVLLRLIQPMLEAYDDTVAICGGVPAPPGPSLASRIGALESLRAWLTRGAAMAGAHKTLPFPGSAILVKRSAVVQSRGFTGGPLELFLRLHALAQAAKKPYRILFLPEPVSRGRTPADRGELRRQVRSSQDELARAFFNRVTLAGPFGWTLLQELFYIRVVQPWLEMAAYLVTIVGLAFGWLDIYMALLVLCATVGLGIVLSMAAVVLRELAEPSGPDERRMAALFLAAIPENIGYRQLRNLWLMGGSRRPPGAPQTENRERMAKDRPSAVSAASN